MMIADDRPDQRGGPRGPWKILKIIKKRKRNIDNQGILTTQTLNTYEQKQTNQSKSHKNQSKSEEIYEKIKKLKSD